VNLLSLLALLAVTGGSSVLTVDEVVVTAERVRHPVRDVAASVSVVTADDLDRTLARTATSALSNLPGVFVQKTGAFGRSDIDIRGVGDRGCRVQVLVDGRPEKMPIYGCVVTHTLPLNNVERIEVVRGPLSVLYGSDAMAGVVNIVTRRAEKPLELGTRLDYGSFGTIHGTLTAGTRQGKLHALLSADKAVSDGHLPNSQYNGNDVSLRAGYDFSSAFQLDFTGKYFDGVKHEPKRSTDPDTFVATGWNHYQRGGLDLTGTLGSETFGGFAKVFRTFGEHIFDPTDGWHSTDFTNGVILHGHRRFQFGNLVQAGVEGSQLSGTWVKSDTNRPTWTRMQAGVFVQDEQELGPVTANAGLRVNWDDISGPVLCPKVGVVGRIPTGTTVRANVNRGFRYAPLNYTSVFPPRNESLKPEVSWNYEVGANQQIVPGLNADVAAFILKGEDFIETAFFPGRVPPAQFQNKGSFTFKGVEAGLQMRAGPWRGSVAYTLTDFGTNTRARAGSKLNLSAGATLRKLDLDLSFQHVARYFAADSSMSPIPAYYTLDLRAGYPVLASLGVFASVENLLDRQYDTYADLPGTQAGLYRMPGRAFTLGLNLRKP
jgi:iron complex outermembrane receptor protein